MKRPLILASQSQVRKTMLQEVGLPFTVIPSPYDEESEKIRLSTLSPSQQAAELAAGKARAVSEIHPSAYVIGADQICALDTHIFDKPGTPERAYAHLSALQGNIHYQHSAACVYLGGEKIWDEVETVILTMRPLDANAINEYIAMDEPYAACGAYRYEANGYKLFSEVNGSAAAIKGLPLEGLLGFLKSKGYPV